MKIYSLLLVKNEEDIIASVLRDTALWSDKVIVMDNGSKDKTWDIVMSVAAELPQVIPYAQDAQTFRIGLRSLMFNAFKNEMCKNDWWCIRLDADEFYKQNPKEFLAKVPFRYKQVYKASIDFFITPEDLDMNFEGSFTDDVDKIRYYQPKTWAEVRFLRHSKKLSWEIDKPKPAPCGLIYPIQIPVFHYQFRSPQQMQNRYLIRQQARSEGCNTFKHEKGLSWRDYLKPRTDLYYYDPKSAIQTLGNRNKFNKPFNKYIKTILTFLRYY